jgi:ketosteroid isomerase-like protein
MAASSNDRAVRDTDIPFSKAGAAKDLERVGAFFASDGSLLPPNLPLAKGKEAIRNVWSHLMENPGSAVNWQPTQWVQSSPWL